MYLLARLNIYNDGHLFYFIFIFFIDRFELSSHYLSYWKLFWQISYRKDTLLKGVPNSCWMSRGSNSHRWKQCSKKPCTFSTVLMGRQINGIRQINENNTDGRFCSNSPGTFREHFLWDVFHCIVRNESLDFVVGLSPNLDCMNDVFTVSFEINRLTL